MSQRVIRYAAPAVADVEEIANHLELVADPTVAKRVVRQIRSGVRRLRRDGHRYSVRPEFGMGRRVLPVPPYLIFYRIDQTTIFVLRILHGSRDIKPAMIDP